MAASLPDVAKQAKRLSPDDRARLAELLLESLRDPRLIEIENAWNAEIQARIAAYERGELKALSAEDVFAEARHIAR